MWKEIKKIPGCRSDFAPGGYGEVLFLPVPGVDKREPSFWMIGRYKDQTRLATALRSAELPQTYVAASRVRLGVRELDKPPVNLERVKRYGASIKGINTLHDFSGQRNSTLTRPARTGESPVNRLGDRKENVKQYWATQTSQSHHIVEFNHLRDMGVSKRSGSGEMDHAQLPCVLLSAELHQRYISSILKNTHGLSESQLRGSLAEVYFSIYGKGGPLFQPLWAVSKIILRRAGVSLAGYT